MKIIETPNWENSKVRQMEKDFNFEKYISERLLEIDDEKTRVEMRELVQHTMIPFYRHTEEAYETSRIVYWAEDWDFSKIYRNFKWNLSIANRKSNTIDVWQLEVETLAENIINKQEKLVTQSVKVAEQKAAQTELKTKIAQQEGNVKSAKWSSYGLR